ncbi:HEAT repeat domain-containing protein [Cohnella soli]|uniref:HEAT repeat domain-containing protein n=1 Tax=Cohnella soli TaxID=425005 RepID=A0ABW0HNT0_9BACL
MVNNPIFVLWISLGLTVLFFVAIVCTWLYSYIRLLTVNKTNHTLNGMLSDIFLNSDESSRLAIGKLKRYVEKSNSNKELLIKSLIRRGDDFLESNHRRVTAILEQTEIVTYLGKLLESKITYKQSLACRYSGDLRIDAMKESMYKLIYSRKNDVIYNMLLALSKMGDLKGLSDCLRENSNHINLSFRAVVEVVAAFRGSLEELVKETIDYCDDYMKGILIKAATDKGCAELVDCFVKYSNSNNKNLRIACIRALSDFKGMSNEQCLIAMLEDKEWEVRAAAAKGLEKIGTEQCLDVLAKAVNDKEWWVRQNAASSLVAISGGKEYANRIVNGNDRFAREAIVGVLEMSM